MTGASPAAPHEGFLAELAAYGDMTRAALLDRLPADGPDGYLYGPIRDYIETSGKGLRPALLIATTKAFGGRAADALTSAAVLELLHNAFLIHDDIEDVSDFRRGRPCLHKRMGVPLAINAGDAMQALGLRLLRRNVDDLGPVTAMRIVDEFDHLLLESLEGQAMELGWIRDNRLDIGPEDYLRMCLKKTCWYSFIHPCRIGALIARPDAGAETLDAFNSFGFLLGAAFQIQDDVLNLEGAESRYGKEIGGDIYEGKRTLMLSRLAALAPDRDRKALSGFLAKPRAARSAKEVDWVHGLMAHHDCIAYARRASRELLEAARGAFETAFAGARPDERRFLEAFMDYMVARDL